MHVTRKLLRVFRVDQQIRGLQSRLRAAERFFDEQVRQLDSIESQRTSIRGQLRQLKASVANLEGEAGQLQEHIDEQRERMSSAKTNKEYKALLTEVNNFKERKSALDESALEHLEKVERLEAELVELDAAFGEREKLRGVAEADRAKRAEEIKDRLAELTAERGEDAMAPLEIVDRKRHEYICGSTMMSVPMETAMSLMSGKLTLSPNDGCILYLTEEMEESLASKTKR
jgi:predicted  nucleic acid-binding Zn-ribbon protein